MSGFIYSAEPGLIIGFHGCERVVCEAIISGRSQMRVSNKSWDWLGDGMYFWQNNYERALHYAQNPPGGLKINEPAVLGAVFSLGNCLDLTDKKSLDIVNDIYSIYAATMAAVIKQVHEIFHLTEQRPFDSVRALLPEGKPLYPGAGFRQKTHIQIAIRNANMIKGYFLPRRESKWSGAPLPLMTPKKKSVTPKK